MYFIGLDIGTSNIKALLTDELGAILNVSILPNVLDGNVYNPDRLWADVVYVLWECVSKAGGRVTAIAISSMAEAGLPLDENLNALYGIIPWSDKRTLPMLPSIRDMFSAHELYERTGQVLQAKYPLARLIWFREREPDIFFKTRKWLSIGDFILFKLTGELVTDYSQACRTMLFNIKDKCWDEELADYCGIGGMLPRVEKMGAHVGNVKDSVLKELGNTSQIEARLGGHDHLVAMSACELETGEVFDSVGTSEVFAGLIDRLNTSTEAFDSGIAQGLIDSERYYWMAGLPSSGASIEWFMQLTDLSYKDILEITDRYVQTEIVYMPYINGSGTPRVDSSAKGMLIGLALRDNKTHILKAIYEGIGFQCKWILETLKYLGLSSSEKLCVCGGGTKNPVWQEIKSDILQRDLKIYHVNDMSAYGAALLARGGVGYKPDYMPISPDTRLDEYYKKKGGCFAEYLKILDL